MSTEFDTSDTTEVICPYCGYEALNSWLFFAAGRDGENAKLRCQKCNKVFSCKLNIDITYTTKKVKNEVSK